jgi:hypothetical protein
MESELQSWTAAITESGSDNIMSCSVFYIHTALSQ